MKSKRCVMKRMSIFFITLLSLGVLGCASKTVQTKAPFGKVTEENSRIIHESFDKVWQASISGLSKNFFVLDNIEKNSKIITLSFAVDDPEPYVDCGVITVNTSGGVSEDKTVSFPSARKYVTYTISDGTPLAKPVERRIKLTGKMNLVFREISKNKVQVTINSRYILHGTLKGERHVSAGFTSFLQPFTEDFSTSFSTGQASESCTAKNTLEKLVLDNIESELLR